MLIEFTRMAQQSQFGEDDEEGTVTNAPISINPANVSAVFAAREGGTILRMNDGRGLHVQGTYQEVMARLHPHHSDVPPLRAV